MAVPDASTLNKCITKFMLETCRFPKMHRSAFLTMAQQVVLKWKWGEENVDVFTSGSSAEFYIEPVVSCIDDMDIMCCWNDSIALEPGIVTPLELPSHFHKTLHAFEITTSNLPGYVYLRSISKLKRKDGRYVLLDNNNSHNDRTDFFLKPSYDCDIMQISPDCKLQTLKYQIDPCYYAIYDTHGPAKRLNIPGVNILETKGRTVVRDARNTVRNTSQTDFVQCIHCATWPKQAAHWPSRQRKNGWPDAATVKGIVNNGCDVVAAVHPLCKQDEWMSEHQWRLSFSRAEVTLLNSWTPLQQIIYHMLRFFIKREMIAQHNDKFPSMPTLCGYHIKTLMMWACEEKPQRWWSAESGVVKLCSSLIRELADWIASKHCRHYFIGQCNLIGHFHHQHILISDDLKTLANESALLNWFMYNYIYRSVLHTCLYTSNQLLAGLCSNNALKQAVDATIDLMLDYQQVMHCSNDYKFESGLFFIIHSFGFFCVDRFYMISRMLKQHPRPNDHFIGMVTLHIAYNVSLHFLEDDLLELLCELFEPLTSGISNNAVVVTEPRMTGAMAKAIHLAKTSIACQNSTERLHLELSKAFLYKAFQFEVNVEQRSTACMAHTLLALLYYKTGHYLPAIGHCKQILSHRGRADGRLHRIEAEYLTSISMNIDSILGLIVFYQHVHNNALNTGKPLQSDVHCTFTTELLAHYLETRCSFGVEKRSGLTETLTNYHRCLIHSEQLLVCDILLYKVVELQLEIEHTAAVRSPNVEKGSFQLQEVNTSSLVFFLEQVALEKLIDYRQKMMDEVHSPIICKMNEFRQLDLYKRGLFRECLKLCRDDINTYIGGIYRNNPVMLALPEMLFLLEGYIVSLIGIVKLQYQISLSPVMCNDLDLAIAIPVISLYLLIECQKKIDRASLRDTLRLPFLIFPSIDDPSRVHFRKFQWLMLKLIHRSLTLYIETHPEM